ncbi:hypothetical protein JW960_14630 [candidate division KSB1 bacterium]|nr:hypothetical protein [candidate division KSB1 bacterium]
MAQKMTESEFEQRTDSSRLQSFIERLRSIKLPKLSDPRYRWFVLSLVSFIVFSVIAWLQPPHPNAYRKLPVFGKDWWLTPLEQNAAQRLPVIETALNAVTVSSDSRDLWAVGNGGLIIHSHNAGRSWERQSVIISTAAPENPAQQQSTSMNSPVQADLIKKQAAYTQTYNSFNLNLTSQGNPSDSMWFVNLHDICFADANHAWIVGDNGTVIYSTTSGTNWLANQSFDGNRLESVSFIDSETGWIIDRSRTTYVTADGGSAWQAQAMQSYSRQQSNTSASIQLGNNIRIQFLTPDIGWKISDGFIFRSNDGGRTWSEGFRTRLPNFELLQCLYFIDENTGWVANQAGAIFHTINGGQTWNRQYSRGAASIHSIFFQDSEHGCAVGDSGSILLTLDGGNNWINASSPISDALNDIILTSATSGWAVGENGAIIATIDGGQNWFLQTNRQTDTNAPYRKWPAPWYYLSLLLVVLFLLPVLERQSDSHKTVIERSIQDIGMSDNPITSKDRDFLDFSSLVQGLSRFLRNNKTTPPLTIAISGEWGTGKSSLMNLLQHDLNIHHHRCVWFNAWHHQKEEHLLASLLESIRAQAIPPLWRPDGLAFRMRLLKLRMQKNWFFVAIVSILCAALTAIFIKHPATLTTLTNLLHDPTPTSMLDQGGTLLSLLVTTILVVGGVWRGVRAFGVKPGTLMTSVSDPFRIWDVKGKAGFRFRFEREFKEVTHALEPSRLVILIDDLDRCRPENVLDVLEAVNFLVTAGNCFIIMGLDMDQVARCVGLEFKDVAGELLQDDGTPVSENPNDAKSRMIRGQFATQYLEKLINIEVPIPLASASQKVDMLTKASSSTKLMTDKASTVWNTMLDPIRLAWPVILLALFIVVGYWLGDQLVNHKPQRARQTAANIAEPASRQAETVTTGTQTSSQAMNQEALAQNQPAQFSDGEEQKHAETIYLIPLLVLIGVAGWRLIRQPGGTVEDSVEFQDALDIWYQIILARHNTPRTIKRFMNRLRFLAMRLPQRPKHASKWQRLFRLREPNPARRFKTSESILVALNALYHTHPEWIEHADAWSKIKSGQMNPVDLKNSGISDTEIKQLKINIEQAIDDHKNKFKNWPPNDDDLKAFLQMSSGIRIV